MLVRKTGVSKYIQQQQEKKKQHPKQPKMGKNHAGNKKVLSLNIYNNNKKRKNNTQNNQRG